jgi:hypothetical protein
MLSILVWMLLCGLLLSACNRDNAVTNTVFPREATIEETSAVLGVEVPSPISPPQGYRLERTTLENSSTVSFAIVRQAGGSEIELTVTWLAVPLKIFNAIEIDINGGTGYFFSRDEDNMIQLNLSPPVQPEENKGIFELTLISGKEIPSGELMLIAASVGW